MKLKNMLAVLLSVCMLGSLLVGCGSETAPEKETETTTQETEKKDEPAKEEEPAEEASLMTAPGELPIVTEPYTITLGLLDNANTTDFKDNLYTKMIEENTGINIEFVLFPSNATEAQQQLELMVTSGEELPDVIMGINLSASARAQYGKDGVVLPLNDYFEDLAFFYNKEKEAQLSEIAQENLERFGLSEDGNLYAFPSYANDPTDRYSYQTFINQTWLDNLGLEMPKTTEDLYNVLKAFVNDDPNGNGKKDEIGMMAATGTYSSDIAAVILNAFTYYSPSYLMNVEDGVVSAPFITEEYREGLRYLNKMVTEGLISPLSFTATKDQYKAMIDLPEDADTILGVFITSPVIVFTADSYKHMEYVNMAPLTGPEGVSWSPYAEISYNYNAFITRDAEDPEICFRFLDYFWDWEVSVSGRYGVKGTNWDDAKEGDTAILPGYEASVWADNAVWGTQTNVLWGGNVTKCVSEVLFGGRVQAPSEDERANYFTVLTYDGFDKRDGKAPDERVTTLLWTDEEAPEAGELKNNIATYVKNAQSRFATGELDIEKDWDAYLKELEAMGLPRYTEMVQTCYTRMFEN